MYAEVYVTVNLSLRFDTSSTLAIDCQKQEINDKNHTKSLS